jgi:hypothetical protein
MAAGTWTSNCAAWIIRNLLVLYGLSQLRRSCSAFGGFSSPKFRMGNILMDHDEVFKKAEFDPTAGMEGMI